MEVNVVADGGEQLHALLKTILQRGDTKHHMAAEGNTTCGFRLLCTESMNVGGGVVEESLYHGGVLHQGHVVTAERHHEQDGPDILETTNPLPPLGSLASNVVHPSHRQASS